MDKSKSKKIKIIIIAEICAVVVIAGVVGGIIYHKNKVKKASTETTLENTTKVQTIDDTTAPDEITSELPTDELGSTIVSIIGNKSTGKASTPSKTSSNTATTVKSNSGNSNTTTTKSFAEQVANYRNNTKKFYNKIGVAGADAGILGYYYDEESDCFRTKSKSWQSHFGFGEIYDSGAAVAVMYYDTARVKFKYNNRDWMVQLWKGQYGVCFLGAEIGLYVKNGGTVSGALDLIKSDGYDCATATEDQLVMSMKLTDTLNGKEEVLFDIKPASYWWLTGFQFGKLKNLADRSELRVDATIKFKDQAMCDAFVAAFEKATIVDQANKVIKTGYFVNGKTFSVSGTTVSFTW